VLLSAGGDGGRRPREHDYLERWCGGRALPWHRSDVGFFGAHALSRCARVARMDSCDPLLATHFLLEKRSPRRRGRAVAFRVDIWDDTGNGIVEHVAGVDDFEVAEATYRAAIARWPAARITLRQGIRVVHDTGVSPRAASYLPACVRVGSAEVSVLRGAEHASIVKGYSRARLNLF
jgi:hypothetical protein